MGPEFNKWPVAWQKERYPVSIFARFEMWKLLSFMKKWILSVLVFALILLFAIPYIFIPSKLTIASVGSTPCSLPGVFRSLTKKDDWAKWWPGPEGKNMPFCTDFIECKFNFKGYTYSVTSKYYNALSIEISKGNQDYDSRIDLISLHGDSTNIRWSYSVRTSPNPIERIKNYREAARQKQNLDTLLLHLKNFTSLTKNVYGQDIHLIMPSDTTLIVIKLKTPAFPGTEEIYSAIRSLREYASANNAKEINYPMLMPSKSIPGAYETFVALSIDKTLPGKGDIAYRRYVPWKDLMVEVKGGDSSVSKARASLNNYIQDNQIQVVSKTFQSLVTDRSIEKDSSKWTTRLICSIP
jgi:hypothetical protein